MPYAFEWSAHEVHKRFWGFVSGAEFAEAIEEVGADPRFDELRRIVNDCLEVEGHSIDAATLERIALTRFGAMRTNPNIRVAMVATDPSLAALAAAVDGPVLRGTHETRSFATLADARAWLAETPTLKTSPRRYI